jgi:hypothetical protein
LRYTSGPLIEDVTYRAMLSPERRAGASQCQLNELECGLSGEPALGEDAHHVRDEAPALLLGHRATGVDDDRGAPGGGLAPQRLQYVRAIHVGQRHVQEDGRWAQLARQTHPLASEAGLTELERGLGQHRWTR